MGRVLLVLSALFTTAQDPAVRALVEKLRSDSVEERDDAARKLKERGAAALPELRKAAADPDAEVAGRVRQLARAIELRGTLHRRLFEAVPGLEDRLASDDLPAWTRAFLELTRRDDQGYPVHPKVLSWHVDPLAERAVRGASTPQDRRAVCRAVELHFLPAAVPELVKLLGDADEAVSAWAGMAIGRVARPGDVPLLLKLMNEPKNSSARRHALEALASLGAREAIPPLLKELEEGEEGDRGEAAEALAGLGAKEAVPGIAKLLRSGESYVRAAAASSLAELGARDRAAEIVPLLKDPDEETRGTAAEALAALGAREAAPEIARLLRDPDEYAREYAAQALGNLGARASIPDLIARFKDPAESEDLKSIVVEVLGDLGAREAIPEISAWLAGGGYLGRRAGFALEAMGGTEAVPTVVKLLGHENLEVRIDSASLLGRIGTAEAAGVLVPLLRGAEPMLRTAAADALGQLRARSAEGEVRSLLKDAETGPRGSAAATLARLGSKESVPQLAGLLSDPQSYVRSNAAYALGVLGSKEWVPRLVPLLGDADAEVRRSAAEALAALGAREETPALRALVEDESHRVRAAAADALGKLEARDALVELRLLLTDSESRVRLAAARALCLLGSREGVLTLVRLGVDRTALNALRQPELWRRLRSVRTDRPPGGSIREEGEALAREAGLSVEWSTAAPWLWERTASRRIEPGDDLLERFRRTAASGEYVLEKDRVRILTDRESAEFWRAWAAR